MLKDGVRRSFREGERIEAADSDGHCVAVRIADGIRIQRIGVVYEEFLVVRQPVVVRVRVVRVGIVDEKLVDGCDSVAVGILVICIVPCQRTECHRSHVCRDGIRRPLVAGE